jgi:hypothetical protein
MQPQTPAEPLLVAHVTDGMAVVDSIGTQAGTVTAVQPPGTGVRPDVIVGAAELLMGSGYIRINGEGHLSNDVYASGDQIARVDSGVVELRVPREDLFRAAS